MYNVFLMHGQIYPDAYYLLLITSRATYVWLPQLWDVSQQTVGVEPTPECIQTDFEAAAITALEKAFPDAEIRGCYFHHRWFGYS